MIFSNQVFLEKMQGEEQNIMITILRKIGEIYKL